MQDILLRLVFHCSCLCLYLTPFSRYYRLFHQKIQEVTWPRPCDGHTDGRMDWRTDGQRHDDSIYRASIASRGKNQHIITKFSSQMYNYTQPKFHWGHGGQTPECGGGAWPPMLPSLRTDRAW